MHPGHCGPQQQTEKGGRGSKTKRWGQIRNVPKKQVLNRLRAFKTTLRDACHLWIQFADQKIGRCIVHRKRAAAVGGKHQTLVERSTESTEVERGTRDGSSSMCFLFHIRVRYLLGR